MKVTKKQAERNRNKVIDAAGRLFRERGFDGVGLIELMAAAGLTHGGFYAKFKSKDDLAVQACELILKRSCSEWQSLVDQEGTTLSCVLENYLSFEQSRTIGQSCVYAALAADVARHRNATLRVTFAEGLQRLVEILARTIPIKSKKAREERALASFATMVGGLVLSRAVDDPEFAQKILLAAKNSVMNIPRP